jgi:hypothetical protein
MTAVNLTVGAEQIDRLIPDAEDLLRQYQNVTGCCYLDYQPITSPVSKLG